MIITTNTIQTSSPVLSGFFRVLALAAAGGALVVLMMVALPHKAEALISGYGDCYDCGWQPEYETYNTYDYYDYGWQPEYETYNVYDYYSYEPDYYSNDWYDYNDYSYQPYYDYGCSYDCYPSYDYCDYGCYDNYDYCDYGCNSGCHSGCNAPEPEPVCALSASDTSIEEGDDVTLHWTSENAYSANLSSFGSVSTGGSRTVSPDSDTTYTLKVTGQGGTDTCSVHINVDEHNDDLSCELDVSDSRVDEGDEVTLTWDAHGATSASINHGIGRVDEDGGDEDVEVDSDTTFRLTVRNDDGDEEVCTATVRVDDNNDFSSISFDGGPVNNPPTVYLSQLPYTGIEDMSPSLIAAVIMLAGLLGISGYFFFLKRRTA